MTKIVNSKPSHYIYFLITIQKISILPCFEIGGISENSKFLFEIFIAGEYEYEYEYELDLFENSSVQRTFSFLCSCTWMIQ